MTYYIEGREGQSLVCPYREGTYPYSEWTRGRIDQMKSIFRYLAS